MRKLSAMFAALFVAAILITGLGATTALAHQGGEVFTFGECVAGDVVVEQPGINGTGVFGDAFYGPFMGHEHSITANEGQGRIPFDINLTCSPAIP